MDNPESLQVSAGGFSALWIPGSYSSLRIEACTLILGVFWEDSISSTKLKWLVSIIKAVV